MYHPQPKRLNSICELVDYFKVYQNAPAIMEYVRDDVWTYSYNTLREDVIKLACALKNKHLSGLRTIIIGESSYLWIVSYLAITSTGGVVAPLDLEMSDEELIANAKKIDAQLILYCDEISDFIQEWQNEVTTVDCVLCFQSSDDKRNDIKNLIESTQPYYPVFSSDLKDETATVIFTSGSTGANKAAMLTHFNIMSNQFLCNIRFLGLRHGRSLLVSPFHHIAGLIIDALGTLYLGDTLCIGGGPRTLYDDIRRFHPSKMCVVPSFLYDFNKTLFHIFVKMGYTQVKETEFNVSDISRNFGSKVHYEFLNQVAQFFDVHGEKLQLFTGGAPCEPRVFMNLLDTCFNVAFGYGMTELAGLVCMNTDLRQYPKSVGRIYHGIDAKLIDKGQDGIGELLISGDCVTPGYYHDEYATSNSFVQNWIKTGDYATISDDGMLTITGRRKNIIIFDNGENISPEELEQDICDNVSAVEAAIVAPVKIKTMAGYQQSLGVLLYVPQIDQMDMEKLALDLQKVNSRFFSSKQIRCFACTNVEFPKTRATNKIKRNMVVNIINNMPYDKFTIL